MGDNKQKDKHMTISKKLIQQMNEHYGTEYIKVEEDKPEDGKVYALTGVKSTACISNGNTWKESEVEDD
jgi:hypothetical protein